MSGIRTDSETSERFQIPGTDYEARIDRDEDGQLTRLSAAGRVYVEARDGRTVLGDGLAEIAEAPLPSGLLRHVRSGNDNWVEEYLWDADRRPTSIDGTRIERDSCGRVTACRSETATWRYGYAGEQLSIIDGPFGTRHIVRAADGRPIRTRESGRVEDYRYQPTGARADAGALPAGYHCDPMGRLWTVTDSFGRVQHTYLWNGLACFGRIDGPPGDPLAAVFSLDPTSTPVRVITDSGVTRIPRDAFGESLMDRAGVPGLYSSAVRGGLMHFRSRKLDPRTGAFTSPDPLCGTERDPRRLKGFQGPLFVDNARYGPYAVCQYDPIGRTDPTGEFSFPLFLSSLTWAWGNNVFSLLVMDATLNFWLSLFGFGEGDDVRGRFWEFQGLSASDRVGTVAFRRDGFWTKYDDARAWTFQHTVYASQSDDPKEQSKTIMDPLNFARVFKPGDEFIPGLYGSLLKVKPPLARQAFLLQSSHNTTDGPGPATGAAMVGWSRYGGKAGAVIPGSRIPRFTRGGFHFGAREGLTSGSDADLVECAPGVAVTGQLKNSVTIVFNGDAADLAKDDIVLFTDATGNAGVFTLTAVEKEGSRHTYHAEPNYIPPLTVAKDTGVDGELRSMGSAAKSTETLTPAKDPGGKPLADHLDLPAAGPDYAANTPLRLTQNGVDMGAAMVKADPIFETRLLLDAPIDPSLVSPPDLPVSIAIADPAIAAVAARTALVAGPSQVDFSPADAPKPAAPALSIVGALTAGATVVPVVLTPTANAKIMQADRDLSSFGASGTTVMFQQFKKDAALGSHVGAPETAAMLTYTPTKPRTVPAGGFVLVEDSGNRASLRAVKARAYDALLLAAPIATGNPALAYTVDALAFDGKVDLNPCNLTYKQEIKLDTPTDLSGFEAFQVLRLQSGTPGASLGSSLIGAAALTDAHAAVGLNAANLPSRPTPGQVVALRQAGNVMLGVVKTVSVTVKVDRQIVSANTKSFGAVPLATAQPQNDGAFLAVRQIMMLPTLTDSSGTVAPAALPLYRKGEHVHISSDKVTDDYQVLDVVGNALVLDPGVGVNLDPTAKNYVITRDASPIDWPYDAEQVSGFTLTAFPTDRSSRLPGGGRVQMPQFQAKELVKANWGGNTPASRHYRVGTVRGTTIDVTDDDALPADTPDLAVVRLDVADPGNGTHRSGLDGAMVNPVPAGASKSKSDTFKFSVWQPSDFNAGKLIAIADTEESHGAVIVDGGPAQVEIDFTASPGFAGNVEVLALNVQDQGFAAAPPDQPADHTTATFLNEPVLSKPGGGMVIVLPYSSLASVHGQVTAGTQRVPEEIPFEIGRYQTLIDHELTHTRQMLKWGQLIFCYFPVWLLEFAGDLFSDQNLPRFSEYAKATVTKDGSRNLLKIEAGSTVTFQGDDQVEISTGGKAELYNLGTAVDGAFPLAHVGSPSTDPLAGIKEATTVFVRRVQGGGAAAGFWKWFMASQRLLTVGGLSKLGFGGIWGGFAYLAGKLGYFLYRKVLGGEDTTYHGIVDKTKMAVQMLPTDSGKFNDVALVRVKKGDDIRIREVSGVEVTHIGGDPPVDPDPLNQPTFFVIKLKTEIDLTGDVEVAPYSTQNTFSQWDWNSNYPARIPDASRPARIQVDKVGSNTFSARQFDRVTITDETTSQVCYVTSVEADGTIDLNRAPFATAPAPDHVFQISSAGVIENTALADLNPGSTAGQVGKGIATALFDPLNVLHMSWMRYLIDPFGQFKPEAYRRGLRTDTGWGKFFTGLTWLARYGLSTESWGILPFFGYFWWDHVFGGKSEAKDYLAEMEQDASQESGNTYSHLSRLTDTPVLVGDIGQFWFFVHARDEYTVDTSRRDAPGVHVASFVRVCPQVADSGASKDQEPNIGFETPDAAKDTGGLALMDLFTKKPGLAPNSATAANPRAWESSAIAQVPVNQELQCALGNYVAFGAPGTHRITIRNSTSDKMDVRAGECQRAKKHTLGIFENDDTLQTVFFDVAVQDLVTNIAGITVANGDAITLLQRQRAPFVVRDQAGRDLTRDHLIFTSKSKLDIQGGISELQAGRTNTPAGPGEMAEFMRLYLFQNDRFDASVLAAGMHLASDNLMVPVRSFAVKVTDAPAVVKTVPDTITLDLYTPAPPDLHPNETVFVLVPSPFLKAGTPTFEYAIPPNPLPPNPSVTVDVLTDLTGFSQSVRDFIGLDGRILSVKLNPAPAPAPVGDPVMKLPIAVGFVSDATVVTATIPLKA